MAAKAVERADVYCEDFFEKDWPGTLDGLLEPILVIGNPPWVTNSAVGALGGSNLPVKSNFQRLNGLDAITGKSNFDISEWMLLPSPRMALRTGGSARNALQGLL